MENTKLELPDFVVRMIKEYQELNGKIVRLNEALSVLSIFEKNLDRYAMSEQCEAMNKYRDILFTRIENALVSEFTKTQSEAEGESTVGDSKIRTDFRNWAKEVSRGILAA